MNYNYFWFTHNLLILRSS